jgi:phosphohistidine phosphatase
MRQLLLLRHAKSSWDDPKLADHARPINARGRLAAGAIRRVMHELGLVPDLVLVSSARRTLQTLEAMEPWDKTPAIEPLDALYLAPASDLLDVLQGASVEARCILLIGHNPGLHDLALLLAGASIRTSGAALRRITESYPSGALAEFSVPGDWSTLRAGGGELTRFLAPADLSEVDA